MDFLGVAVFALAILGGGWYLGRLLSSTSRNEGGKQGTHGSEYNSPSD